MSFLNPSTLWLLIPLVILFAYRPKNIVDSTHIIIMILIVLSLSRPILNEEVEDREVEGRDIIVAIDLSFSMRADDIYPNRYDYAKDTVKSILDYSVSDNIMLIGFTTNPLLLSPPTTDHKLVAIALDSINRDYILTKGTSLKNLFNKVADISVLDKNLLLITDGGEESDYLELSKIIKESNIKLTILAMGTKEGRTLKKLDGTYLKDLSDNLVVSRLNPMLEKLANSVNGNYLIAKSTPKDTADDIYSLIKKSSQMAKSFKELRGYIDLYQIPLFLATILFLIIHTRAIKYLVVFISLFGTNLDASVFDDVYLYIAYHNYKANDFNGSIYYLKKIDNISLESEIALANSYYKEHRYKEALEIYQSISSTSLKIKKMIYYNMGNCYSYLKEYDRARASYIKSLWIESDSDVLYNLSLVIIKKSQIDALSKLAKPSSNNSSTKGDSLSEDNSKESKDGSSGANGGGQSGSKSKKERESEKKLLLEAKPSKKQPVSSKVYDLINKGYINEKEPW